MKPRSFLSSMSFVFFLFSILTSAAVLALGPIVVHADEIDTEHLFVFAVGTDIGEVGERELESETNSRIGKRTGSYTALSQSLEAEFTPIENFRLSIGGSLAYHNIAGVNGFRNRRKGSFEGVFVDMRYRFLDRAHSIFGLTVAAEPQWGRIDETSGEPSGQYGLELAQSRWIRKSYQTTPSLPLIFYMGLKQRARARPASGPGNRPLVSPRHS